MTDFMISLPVSLSEDEVKLLETLKALDEISPYAAASFEEEPDGLDRLITIGLIASERFGDTMITRGRRAGRSRGDGITLYRISELGEATIRALNETADSIVSAEG